jgi:uncharacterized protein
MEPTAPHPLTADQAYLVKLANARMPFGRYAGVFLGELPEPYLVWFSRKGFPKGQLGDMLRIVYEMKSNGLEYLLRPLRRTDGAAPPQP